VLDDLMADWHEGGAAAIKVMRIERAAEYARDGLDLAEALGAFGRGRLSPPLQAGSSASGTARPAGPGGRATRR
jgi:hypothetical protein